MIVIDDDIPFLSLIRDYLSSQEIQVTDFQSPVKALEHLRSSAQQKPSLVVSDVQMNEMDGWGVLAEVKRVDENIPVVLMTSNATKNDEMRSSKLGAAAYLEKPFSLNDFKKIIEAVRRKND